MPLVPLIPMASKIDYCDLPNRVSRDEDGTYR
jgi:hypothetical protein